MMGFEEKLVTWLNHCAAYYRSWLTLQMVSKSTYKEYGYYAEKDYF